MGLPFHLRCLGRPQLISPGGEPVRLRVRKHLAVLVYLALEPRGQHRRERMADLLWPNVSPRDGRHSVATAISMLRGKLGRELVQGDRDHVQLVGSGLTLDLDRLAAGKILGDDFVPALEIGGFLEDFEIADAPEFMMWRERQRARWLPLVRDALVLLIDRCRRTGDFRRIEQLGNSLLEIDELSEDGIRAKMEARAFDGDRVTALKVFQIWKAKLASELDAVPSSLIEGMAIRLRQRGWETAPVTNIPTVPTDQWRGRPFIGRGPEYETLYNAWESTCAQIPRHVLVLGDSGVGKSTLLERVVTAAGLEGAAISRVQCYELEREIPYAAVGSLIEGLLDRPGASGTAPEWLAELARTVPQVRRRFPGIPEAMDTQGETARLRLTEAVQQLAMAIAEDHPVILVLDDVHLADDASLAVLHLMMRRTLDKRVMVLMAARTGELGQSPHAVRLREGHEHLRMTVLELQPMSLDECEEMLGWIISRDNVQPPHTVRRALLRAAAGYPMVLEYLVEDWQRNGEKCLALSIGAMTEEPQTVGLTSQTYHLILNRIVQDLDPATRNVLSMAAILGSRLNDLDLYQVADASFGQAMMGLGRLADLRILREGTRGLEFNNELVRGEAYLTVPSVVRKTLHRNVAQQLLDMEGRGQSVPGLEIAWHLIRAGQSESATPYLLRGAREAIQSGAPHEAELGLKTAMGHLKEPAKTDAVLLQAEALYEQGKWRAVLEVLNDCSAANNPTKRDTGVVLVMEARRRLGIVAPEVSDSIFQELIDIAASSHNPSLRVRSATNIAYLLVHKNEPELDATVLHIIDTLDDVELDDSDFAQLALARALMDYRRGARARAEKILGSASERLKDKGIRNLALASLQVAIGGVRISNGDYHGGSEFNLEAYKLAHVLGNDHVCIISSTNLALCRSRLGDYKGAIEWARRSLSRDTSFNTPPTRLGLYHGAIAHAMIGEDAAALNLSDVLARISGPERDRFTRQNSLLYLADVHGVLGRQSEAYSFAAQATGRDLSKLISPNSAGIYSRWLAVGVVAGFADSGARARLYELLERRLAFDRLDQIEVLCAFIWLGERDGADMRNHIRVLKEELGTIPSSAVGPWRRMGFLSIVNDETTNTLSVPNELSREATKTFESTELR